MLTPGIPATNINGILCALRDEPDRIERDTAVLEALESMPAGYCLLTFRRVSDLLNEARKRLTTRRPAENPEDPR